MLNKYFKNDNSLSIMLMATDQKQQNHTKVILRTITSHKYRLDAE